MSGTKHCAVPLICRLKAYTPLLLLSLIPSKVPPVAHQGSWIIYATICLCILLFMNLSKHVDDVLFDMWLSNFSFSHSWSTKLKHNGNSSYNYVISSIYIMPSFWVSWHVDHDELYFVWKKTSIYHFTHAAAVVAVVSWYMTANLHRPMSIIQWQHGIEWPTLKSFLLGHCTPWPLSLQNVTCSWFLVATSSCFVQDWTVSRCPCWLVW